MHYMGIIWVLVTENTESTITGPRELELQFSLFQKFISLKIVLHIFICSDGCFPKRCGTYANDPVDVNC